MNKFFRANPHVWNRNGLIIVFLFVLLFAFSPFYKNFGLLYHPFVHVSLDVLSIVVCIMIFIIGWHSYQYNRLPFVLLIAVPFFEVGLLDLLHMLLFVNGPEQTFGEPRKEVYYWLWARLIESLSILVSLLWPWKQVQNRWFKPALILACIFSFVLIFGLDLVGEVFFPQLFAERLTPFRAELGLFVIPLHLWAMWLVWRNEQLPSILRSHYIFFFLLVSAIAEACFIASSDTEHVLYFLGHLSKVVAYGFLLQAILIHGIRSPYERLAVSTKILENISDAVLITDARQKIIFVNPSFTKLTGYAAEEAIGQTPGLLKSGVHMNDFYEAIWKSLYEKGIWQGEIWDRKKNGELFLSAATITVVKDEQGKMTNFASLFNDVTKERLMEKKIRYQAYHDSLTGLYNRTYLFAKLDEALRETNRPERLAVIFVDLDRFKQINDGLGHESGDQLLCQVSQRLLQAVRKDDIVARFGGDEFVILLTEFADLDEVTDITRRMLTEIEKPFELNGQMYFIGASIGVSFYPSDGADRDTLIKCADLAMYKAKENGGGIVFYDAEMRESGTSRMRIETLLRKSIQQPDFQLFFQPQLTPSGDIIGAEVLIRWGPNGEWIPPEMFIAVAEDTGLIKHLDRWVLMTACQKHLEWMNVLNRPFRLAVNISTKQFQQSDFIEYVRYVLETTRMQPEWLELEITESAFIDQPGRVVHQIHDLKKMGVRIAIDDFGSGYSSLLYLRDFPVDTLKIDRGFIQGLEDNPANLSIVKAILQVSQDLGIEVVAEGVETMRQKEILERLRCDVLQGYLFGSPMSADEMLRWLMKKVS